jgi:betaine reductase
MPNAAIHGVAYCLNHVPGLALHYGNTPYVEREAKGESDFLKALPAHEQDYDAAVRYAPNLAYIGARTLEELEAHPKPWYQNPTAEATRFGRFGEIMPEEEFLGLLDACDVFDLIWLERSFAASARERLAAHPLMTEAILARIEAGHEAEEIARETSEAGALPLLLGGRVVGCARRGHEIDEDLSAYVLLENLACKAGGVLALLHLMRNADLAPGEVDFLVECSEEAAGDMNQRGGGNFAKAVAEIAGCGNASGCDVRGFCAGPVNAILAGASMVAAGTRQNVVVLAGGAIPKLYMNARDHVKKGMPALENCLGNFAVLIGPDDGAHPVIRLDAVGKHSVAAGASPQAITTSLVFDPLAKLGLGFDDVDKYAAELHIPEITLPAGAGDVPLANFKMIAALAVMKGQLEKAGMNGFVAEKGIPGFAHTQGHIPSGVPFLGHACEGIRSGALKRVMIIGKGSLFLARMTNLSDGASFLVEAPAPPSTPAAATTKEEIKAMLLEALADLASGLKGPKAP